MNSVGPSKGLRGAALVFAALVANEIGATKLRTLTSSRRASLLLGYRARRLLFMECVLSAARALKELLAFFVLRKTVASVGFHQSPWQAKNIRSLVRFLHQSTHSTGNIFPRKGAKVQKNP